MEENEKQAGTCPVCGNKIEECVCCPECGHVCLADTEEGLECPVCGPKRADTRDKEK